MHYLYRMIIIIAWLFSFCAINGSNHPGNYMPSSHLSIAHIVAQFAEHFCTNVLGSGRSGLNFCLKYPRVMILVIASIALAIPQVRQWISRQAKNGVSALFGGIINGVMNAIHQFFFGKIDQSIQAIKQDVQQQGTVLALHTEKLDFVQGGIGELKSKVSLLHTDVTAVQKRLEDAHVTLASIQTDVQGQTQELHSVHKHCDEIKVSLDGYGQQVITMQGVLNRLDGSFDERVGRQVAGLAATLAYYKEVFDNMNKNVLSMKKTVEGELAKIMRQITGLATTHKENYNSLQSSLNAHATSIGKRLDKIEKSGAQRHREMLFAFKQGLVTASANKKVIQRDKPFIESPLRLVPPACAT